MQPYDKERLETLEIRIKNLEAALSNCTKLMRQNNALLENIISSLPNHYSTSNKKNQMD